MYLSQKQSRFTDLIDTIYFLCNLVIVKYFEDLTLGGEVWPEI
jgi:hypothetical protein